jgi:rubrerythrin
MSEQSLTTSAVISFAQELELRSSHFYGEMAKRFVQHRDTFAGFARDCTKSITRVTRTYQETISDALEAGFSFQGLRLEDYKVDPSLPESVGLSQAIEMALSLEDKAIAFYLDVAERSESLLATIPRAFTRAARTRRRRKTKLESL